MRSVLLSGVPSFLYVVSDSPNAVFAYTMQIIHVISYHPNSTCLSNLGTCVRHLDLVAGVGDLGGRNELLLDSSNIDEAGQEVLATSLVVGSRGARATEGLLTDNSTSALAVDVEVASGVAEVLLSKAGSLTVSSKDSTGQTVVRGGLDELADIGHGVRGGVIVDVGGEDRTKELGREELVVRVGSGVDGRVDVVALGRVILATNDELEVLVALCLINGTRKLLEGSFVNDGTHEVEVLSGVANLDGLNLSYELLLELGPLGLGDVESGSGTALLALELESTTDGLLDSIINLCGRVNQVEVFATSLTNDTGVASVSALSDTLTDGAVELTENAGAASVVEGSKLLVLKDNLGDVDGVTRDKLDNVLREASLNQDLVDEPIGGNGKVTGLPDNNVTKKSRGTGQVTGNGSKVEGANSIDETFEGTVLETVPDTRRVVLGLDTVELLSVVYVEAEEVSQLSSGIDLSLPSVLALTEHGSGHDVVTVLGGDQIGSLEEDGGSVGEGERLPSRLGSQSSVNGGRDICSGGSVVRGNGGGMVGRVLLLGESGSLDLLAANNDGNLDGQLLLELLNGSGQTLSLLATLGVVLVGLVEDLGGLERSQSRSSSHLLDSGSCAKTASTSSVKEHHGRHCVV
jgi:hypothetical protein